MLTLAGCFSCTYDKHMAIIRMWSTITYHAYSTLTALDANAQRYQMQLLPVLTYKTQQTS